MEDKARGQDDGIVSYYPNRSQTFQLSGLGVSISLPGSAFFSSSTGTLKHLSNSSHLTFPQQLLYVGGFLLSLPRPEILQKQRPIISFLLPQFVH